jgi:hypothetical protein
MSVLDNESRRSGDREHGHASQHYTPGGCEIIAEEE